MRLARYHVSGLALEALSVTLEPQRLTLPQAPTKPSPAAIVFSGRSLYVVLYLTTVVFGILVTHFASLLLARFRVSTYSWKDSVPGCLDAFLLK